jgi:ubiquitin-activating enzyme E1 C
MSISGALPSSPLSNMANSYRFVHLKRLLDNTGPFVQEDFEPGIENIERLNQIKILVIGAGGLGCELLKDLAYMGFSNIHIIDMDTIDLSNLNRQFLFRQKDIGRSKAEVAAEFINRRVKGCHVTPHFKRIQDMEQDFYRSFNIVVCGLDSILARRWINGLLLSLLDYDEQTNQLDQSTVIPLIDGGTEGFKGNARLILPGITACIECTLDLYPPQVTFPLCTIANKPRLPEHCIEYARVISWTNEKPFGPDVAIDGDEPTHLKWIYERAVERANEFGILGVTYRLTQGVIKNIIPAVASTNACIATMCATEAFKLATGSSLFLNNYVVFNQSDGVYTYVFEAEKKPDCLACNRNTTMRRSLEFSSKDKLSKVIKYLCENIEYQMKSPALTATKRDGVGSKTLYMSSIKSIEEATRPNLALTLEQLELFDGQEILVADVTTPQTLAFKLKVVD